MKYPVTLLAMVLLLSSFGCVKAVRGIDQKLLFDTEPGGATLKVAGKTYTTPVELALKRSDKQDIEISMAGFKTIQFTMEAQWDGASIAEFALPGGSVLTAVDASSGADRSFYPLKKIKLTPGGKPDEAVRMYQFRQYLMLKADYDKAVEHDRSSGRFFSE